MINRFLDWLADQPIALVLVFVLACLYVVGLAVVAYVKDIESALAVLLSLSLGYLFLWIIKRLRCF